MTPAFRLRVLGPDEDVLIPLDAPLSFGRAPEADVQLGEPLASRVHCEIQPAGEGWKLVDLESQNGTCVNGERVNHRVLAAGDTITIGATEICFEPDPTATAGERRLQAAKRGLRRYRVAAGSGRRRGRRRATVAPPAAEPVAEPDADALETALIEALRAIHRTYGAEGLAQAEKIFGEFTGTEGKAALAGLRDEAHFLARVLEVAKALTGERALRRVLSLIMDAAVELTQAERGFLILLEGDAMKVAVARNFDKESVRNPFEKISRSLAQQVVRTGEAILASNAQDDPRFQEYMSVADLKLRSVLCAPLKIRDQVLGVLYLDNRFTQGVFTERERALLAGFCDQAAVAMENARLHEEAQAHSEALEAEKEKVEQLNKRLAAKVSDQQVELRDVKADLAESRKQLALKYNYDKIVGRSAPMQQVFRLLDRITDSDVPVLIQGESGTGKELVARAIHFNGPRRARRFVSENCAAIPESLLESELFGHVRGAFTGAVVDKKGLFEVASGGTLFLDEIGDMPLEMQAKLLRALQDGEIRRVGGKDSIRVDVRVLSASNKDLRALIKEQQFRDDLFYRLNVVTVALPALRERREDIPVLVDHFLDVIAAETRSARKVVQPRALSLLSNHAWPGNVRELENEIRRAVALSGETIGPDELSPELRGAQGSLAARFAGRVLKDVVREATDEVERAAILAALEASGWNKVQTAALLGVSRPTLDSKMDQLGIAR